MWTEKIYIGPKKISIWGGSPACIPEIRSLSDQRDIANQLFSNDTPICTHHLLFISIEICCVKTWKICRLAMIRERSVWKNYSL